MRLASRLLTRARPPAPCWTPPPRRAAGASRALAAAVPPGDEEAPETPVSYEEVDDGGVDWCGGEVGREGDSVCWTQCRVPPSRRPTSLLHTLHRGATALATARTVLTSHPDVAPLNLALYSFRATPAPTRRVAVRLDALASPTGSPSLDEVAAFSTAFNGALETALGEEEAGLLEVEASSPGADRELRLPADLTRFAELPLAVVPVPGSAAAATLPPSPAVLTFVEFNDAGAAVFGVPDTRATRGQSGKLTAKQKAARYDVELGDLERVTLHVDI